MSTITLKVNGHTHSLDVDAATPLLYVLSDDLELRGAKFGCALANAAPARSSSKDNRFVPASRPYRALTERRSRRSKGWEQTRSRTRFRKPSSKKVPRNAV